MWKNIPKLKRGNEACKSYARDPLQGLPRIMHCLNTAAPKISPLLSSLCEMKFLSTKNRGRTEARGRENKQELQDSNLPNKTCTERGKSSSILGFMSRKKGPATQQCEQPLCRKSSNRNPNSTLIVPLCGLASKTD